MAEAKTATPVARSTYGKAWDAKRIALYFLLAAIMILVPIACTAAIGYGFLVRILVIVGIWVLLALGLNIVVGYAGLLDLGYIAFYAMGGYAGVLIGQYAKAALGGKPAKIAMLDLFPGHPVGAQRHNGFMTGFGLKANDAKSNELSSTPETVCAGDTDGNQAKGQTAMENCLQKDPAINVVYTINEPAAAGAYNALKKAGKDKGVIIVSVDGGCAGIADVGKGVIAATSQQYPLKMAAMGVAAGVDYAKGGKKASGYVDTGVTLIAGKAVAGVESKDVKTGTDLCWGTK